MHEDVSGPRGTRSDGGASPQTSKRQSPANLGSLRLAEVEEEEEVEGKTAELSTVKLKPISSLPFRE